MSVNCWVSITVRGHVRRREPAIVEALAAWAKDERLDGPWSWHRPRVVPAASGGHEVQHDSKMPVILTGAGPWRFDKERELAFRVGRANGEPCEVHLELSDGDDPKGAHPEARPGRYTCDPKALAILWRCWDDDQHASDGRGYLTLGCGPAQHAGLIAGYRLLPEDKRSQWVWLVARGGAPDPAIAVVLREHLRAPLGERLSGSWHAHMEALRALDGGSEAWEEFLEHGPPGRLERLMQRVAGGMSPAEARAIERPACDGGPRRAVGGAPPVYRDRHAPFVDVPRDDARRGLPVDSPLLAPLLRWLVDHGHRPPREEAARAGDSIDVELVSELLRVLLEDRLPPAEAADALGALAVDGDVLLVPPRYEPGGAPWLEAARDLLEDEALLERVAPRAAERVRSRRAARAAELAARAAADPLFALGEDRVYELVREPQAADVWMRLARHPEERARRVVAEAAGATPDALALLGSDPDDELRGLVADHERTPPATLARLASDRSDDVRRGVARHAATPQGTLAALASDPEDEVRVCVASNERTPPEALLRLADDEAVHDELIRNPGTPPDAIARLAQAPQARSRARVAERPGLAADLVLRLAGDPARDVRGAVAARDDAPADLLERLAGDPDARVRGAAARNARAPVALLERLAADPALAGDLACNAAAPPELLARLADAAPAAVARCRRTPPATLTRLAAHAQAEVRRLVLANASAPREALEVIARGDDSTAKIARMKLGRASPG